MYNWRKMSDAQRKEALRLRQHTDQPWHGPPHGLEKHWYHVSAACYEHRPVIGAYSERMAAFERELVTTLASVTEGVTAWCVRPNHYHVLVQCINLPAVRKAIGALHGRTSCQWNRHEGTVGRKCWHRCLPKPVTSERHRWATMNYVHHNPVHHGYAKRWRGWPFSSAEKFVAAVGRPAAERIWMEYPVLEFGRGWDEPEM